MAQHKKKPSARDMLKIEVAKELGLWEKIQQFGWAELTAEESGRIGGMMTRKMRKKTADTADTVL